MRRIQSAAGVVLATAVAGHLPPSLAVEPMTVAAVASLGAKGLELFKSGADQHGIYLKLNPRQQQNYVDKLKSKGLLR